MVDCVVVSDQATQISVRFWSDSPNMCDAGAENGMSPVTYLLLLSPVPANLGKKWFPPKESPHFTRFDNVI